ncbi:MAG: hypothetical protein JNK84_21395 [Phreatobacter sp.]|uniref:hypothetical protein n=1 Tax=Phreatobacter sp. TaxID=1966341 RepID=UPI001A3924FC|nr:hypothetical protein [Phreatobacter sp.]MBL8571638.1 hypothetical protein [Phreatobacter sp.]
MIPGHSALGGIEGALAELRQAESNATRRLDDANRQATEAQAAEGDLFRQLAAFRLNSESGLGGRLNQVATQVRAVLALRLNDRNNLDKRVVEVEARIAKIAADREAFAKTLIEAEEQRTAVQNEAQVGLAARQDYASTRASAEQASQVAAEADRKAKLAEDELETKRKPYESDALFIYLWKRSYATQDYSAGNIARLIDGWVARLVRYQDARPNYARLTEIPKRLREHANRAAAAAVDAVEQVKAMEKSAFLAVGGDRTDAAIAEQRRRLDALEAARQAAEQQHEGLEKEAEAFGRGQDARFQQAVGMLAETLRGEDIDRLYQEARRTPSPEDEALVGRIQAGRDAQERFAAEARKVRADLAEISRRRSETSQVATGFRQRRYDADGSVFDNDVVGALLRGLVTGVITGADYWSRMEQGRRWNRRRDDDDDGWGRGGNWGGGGSWGGGSSGGSWGGGSSGGSWGGGGGSSGGSWGGGGGSSGGSSGGGDGFETGGRF